MFLDLSRFDGVEEAKGRPCDSTKAKQVQRAVLTHRTTSTRLLSKHDFHASSCPTEARAGVSLRTDWNCPEFGWWEKRKMIE